MRAQALMLGVYFQVAEGLLDLLKDREIRQRILKRCVLLIGRRCEFELPLHAYSLACSANEPR